MRSTEYDWKTLAKLGAAKIVEGLEAPQVRDVDPQLITPVLAEAADGIDPKRPIRVCWAPAPPPRDAYVFEQDNNTA